MPSPPTQEATSATMPPACHFRLIRVCISPERAVMASIGKMARVFCI